MKSTQALVLLAALLVNVVIADGYDGCPPNEEWDWCGITCEEHCNRPPIIVCPSLECIEGCFCKEGFLRKTNDGGNCVRRRDCPLPGEIIKQ